MAIINRVLPPLNGRMQTERPYVDDMFDPLFNEAVRNYYNGLYGNRALGIAAGYADMWDNALTGGKGILGPGMGILSTFGRSMDKTGDILLGGLTEGVNYLGQLTGGLNPEPVNPLRRIMVDDYDYQGAGLMAAAGNAMAKLAGTQTPLDETNFSDLGSRMAGMSIDLMTDPGILGSRLAKLNPGTPVGQVGQALDNYDNFMAKIASDVAFPGGRTLASKGINQIFNLVGGAKSRPTADTIISDGDIYARNVETYKGMSDGYANYLGVNPMDDPYNFDKISKINKRYLTRKVPEQAKLIIEESSEYIPYKDFLEEHASKFFDHQGTPEQQDVFNKIRAIAVKMEIEGVDKITDADIPDDVKSYLDDMAKVISEQNPENPIKFVSEKDFENIAMKENYPNIKDVWDLEEPDIDSISKLRDDYVRQQFDTLKKASIPKKGQPHVKKYTSPSGSEVAIKSSRDLFEEANDYNSPFIDKLDDVMDYKKYSFFGTDEDVANPGYARFRESYNKLIDTKNKLAKHIEDSKNLEGDDELTALADTMLLTREYNDVLDDVVSGFDELVYKHPDLETIFKQYTHTVPTRKSVYNLALSSADFREKHTKEIVDAIAQTTAVFVRKYPEAFKNLNLNDINDFTSTFSKGIKNSMAEYVLNDERLLNVLSLDASKAARIDNKLSKGYIQASPELIKQFEAFRHMASNFSVPHIRKYLDSHPELETLVEDLILDDVYVPNLKRIFGQFRNEKKWNNTIHTFITSLKGTKDANGNVIDRGLLGVIRDNEEILSKPGNEFGQDLLTWANNVESIIKNATIEDNAMNAANAYLDLSDFEVSDKGLAQLRATLPGFDVTVNEDYKSFFTNTYVKPKQKHVNVGKDILNAVKPYAKPDVSDTSKVVQDIAKLQPEQFEKTVVVTKPVPELTLESAKEDIIKNLEFTSDPKIINSKDLTDVVKQYGNRDERRLYALLDSELNSKYAIKAKQRTGTERIDSVRKSKALIDKVASKYTPEQVRRYLELRSSLDDQIIKGDEMLDYVIGSKGHVEVVGLKKEEADAIYNVVKANVDKINKHGKILEAYNVKTKSGNVVGYRLDYNNINIKKDLTKYFSGLTKREALDDMVFYKGVAERPKDLDQYADLEEAFESMKVASQDLSTKLGFTDFNENYFKFVMKDDDRVAKAFNDLAEATGNDLDKLDKLTDALLDFNARGSFGTVKYNKAYLGPFNRYPGMFSTDLKEIHSATFSKGMLDNTNSQTFFDLFLSDNFTIKNNFKDFESLKNALYVKDDTGKLYGNLTNLSVVAPKYNSNGKLVGFKQYNKFSDIELKQAFEDDTAVLLPNQLIAPLDRMLKKDARMSNKFYQFINKYVTVPFKFGTLSNPGFLVGNMTDAYFKQALEMSKKYGTNLEDEIAEVAMSMNEIVMLNNKFDDVFDEYRKFLESDEAIADPIFKKSRSYGKLLTPALVMNNPEFLKAWTVYLNKMPDGANRKVAKLYTFINNRQNTALFDNNNLDLEDVIDKTRKNPYDVPTNTVERIIYGKQGKGIKSWGLMLNNPLSDFILKKSNQIETHMRSAAILNDLKHQGMSTDVISDILEMPKDVADKTRRDLRIQMHDAVNTMHSANFDYDNVSNFMNTMSYVMPFPTFYLKNIAYWLDVLVENPQKIDKIISAHEALWSAKEEDVEKDEFAAEAKGRGAVPVFTGKKHLAGFVKQTPYTSMFGAFNALNDPQGDFWFRTNPLLRPVTRHLQRDEDVRYRPYSTNQYEKNIKQGDKEFNDLAYMFHQLNPYDKFINNMARLPGKIDRNDYRLSDFASSLIQPDF